MIPSLRKETLVKKNTFKAKLTLHRETLRALDRPVLEAVVGGLTQIKNQCATQTCRCTFTCP